LEYIEILVLGGIPKIPKLFDFGLILADYGSFQQPFIASGSFQKHGQVLVDSNSLQQVQTDAGRFSYIWIWLTGPI
jgi:hypothetical protein